MLGALWPVCGLHSNAHIVNPSEYTYHCLSCSCEQVDGRRINMLVHMKVYKTLRTGVSNVFKDP